MMMAGLDGIRNQDRAPDAGRQGPYDLPPDEAAAIPRFRSLSEVLDNLERDNEYLQEGGVFTSELIENLDRLQRINEVDPVRLRPHPYEFELYYKHLTTSAREARKPGLSRVPGSILTNRVSMNMPPAEVDVISTSFGPYCGSVPRPCRAGTDASGPRLGQRLDARG